MAKITDYTINNNPDPETEYFVVAYNGLNYKILNGNANFFSPHNKQIPKISDFLNTLTDVFFNTAIAAGTDESDHPGEANSGTIVLQGPATSNFVFLGGEILEGVFSNTVINTTYGWRNGPPGAITHGIYIVVGASFAVSGKCVNASVVSTTPTSYTITSGTWYRFKIMINAAKTRVDFLIYDVNGNLVWSDGLGTNIPASVPASTACSLVDAGTYSLDWLAYYNNTELVR